MTEPDSYKRLTYATAELGKAKPKLERLHSMNLESIEVQWALTEALGIELGQPNTLEQLIELCPDAATIVQLLKDFSFQRFMPKKLGEVEMQTDIIPAGVPRQLQEQKIRSNGKVWTIHRNDADPFPSNPHAHNYDEGLKLDLSDGTLYRYKRPHGRIKIKDLIDLRAHVKDIELPPLAEELAAKYS